jgi:hypothetical protein
MKVRKRRRKQEEKTRGGNRRRKQEEERARAEFARPSKNCKGAEFTRPSKNCKGRICKAEPKLQGGAKIATRPSRICKAAQAKKIRAKNTGGEASPSRVGGRVR